MNKRQQDKDAKKVSELGKLTLLYSWMRGRDFRADYEWPCEPWDAMLSDLSGPETLWFYSRGHICIKRIAGRKTHMSRGFAPEWSVENYDTRRES